MSQTIQILDERTINKIAAGEVIERPASVVKELLENALDAGSTSITIELDEAGKKRIRLSDNGKGISSQDLSLAPLRHATSKITSIDDVYRASTFGFRGEALSSICHVAKLAITSKTDRDAAYGIHAFQDDITTPELDTRDQGTTVDVRDLFLNIPVRAKFLKSNATELSYSYDVVLHYALLHPDKSFILRNNGKELVNTTGISDQKALLIHFFGKDLNDKIVKVNETIGGVRCEGYITNPTLTFSNRKKQIIGINQRLVKSSAIQKAIMDSYRDLIAHRRFPLVVLNLTMSSDLLDVNIHPQKMEVKFLQPGFIFDALLKSIKFSLQTTHDVGSVVGSGTFTEDAFTNSAQTSSFSGLSFSNVTTSETTSFPTQGQNTDLPFNPKTHENMPKVVSAFEQGFSPQKNESLYSKEDLLKASLSHIEFLQCFDTYLIIKGHDAVWILDQHAVHERILYEKIKEDFGKVTEKQPLLISEIVDLTPDLFAIYSETKTIFDSFNFVTEEFGESQVVVREVPINFVDTPVSELMTSLLEELKDIPGRTKDLTIEMKEVLQLKACKAAIKAGKRMREEEVKQLIHDFIQSPSNYTCPHGRPLYIRYTKTDFEKLFMRI